ncbi:MAG: hypothetical protein ACJAUH_000268 [Saprospiraceae bacterium]|jgi:hypothetical protein
MSKLYYRINNRLSKVIIGLITLLIFSACTKDLSTKIIKRNSDTAKAKTLMQDMAIAHNITAWDDLDTYSVSFQDEFFGKLGAASNPYAESKTEFTLVYIPKSFDGQLQFKSGINKGISWGLQSWKTYVLEQDEINFSENEDILFWIPTYQYFIEFPARIQKATAFDYAGKMEINGKMCDGVMASWNTIKPQREIDQYLIWLDSETKRIVKLEYTIREVSRLIKGAVYFNDYKDYEGIILPSILPVVSPLSKNKWLHEMQIKDFTRNPVNTQILRPDKMLEVMGDNKD